MNRADWARMPGARNVTGRAVPVGLVVPVMLASRALRVAGPAVPALRAALAGSTGPHREAGQILIHGKGGRTRVVLLPAGVCGANCSA